MDLSSASPLAPRRRYRLRTLALGLLMTALGLSVRVPLPAGAAFTGLKDTDQSGGTVGALSLDEDGARACVGVGARVAVLDVGDPDLPRELLRTDLLPGAVLGCALRGDQLLALTPDFLLSISVAGGIPTLVDRLALPGKASAMAVSGDVAAVIGLKGFVVVDVDPSRPPTVLAHLPELTGLAIAIERGMAAVGQDTGLQLVDLAQPSKPVLKGKMPLGQELGDSTADIVYAVGWAGSTLLVGTETYLAIIDASDPSAPKLAVPLEEAPYISSPSSLVVTGNAIFVIGHLEVLRFDRARLPRLDLVAPHKLPLARWATTAVAIGDRLLVGVAGGLLTLDVGRLRGPERLGTVAAVPYAVDLARYQGGLVVLARQPASLSILDTADPVRPVVLGSLLLAGLSRQVVVSGKLAYVTTTQAGLQVIDLADPVAPRLLGRLDLPGEPEALAASGGLVLVSCGGAGLQTVDVTDPSRPRIIASLPDEAEALAFLTDRLALALGAGLRVIDVKDPASPIVGQLDNVFGSCLLPLTPTLAYACGHDFDGQGGFLVLDLTEPSQPRYQAVATSNAMSLAAGDGYLWLGNAYNITLWSMENLRLPSQRWTLEDAMVSIEVAPGGAWAYGISKEGDLVAFGGRLKAMRQTHHWGEGLGITHDVAAVPGGALVLREGEGQCCETSTLQAYTPLPGGRLLPGGILPLAGSVVAQLAADGAIAAMLVEEMDSFTEVNSRLYLLDTTDPREPTVSGSLVIAGGWNHLATSDGRVVIGGGEGLMEIDVSQPDRPRPGGRLPGELAVHQLAISGDMAYVVSDGALIAVDLGQDGQPRRMGQVALAEPDTHLALMDLVIISDRAYLAFTDFMGRSSPSSIVAIFDLSDPAAPRLLQRISADGVWGLATDGVHLLLSAADGLHIYLPAADGLTELAVLLGRYQGPVAIRDGRFYVAAREAGLISGSFGGSMQAVKVFLPQLGR